MSKNFETIRDVLITLLATEAGTDFRVVGAQQRAQAAEGIKGDDRSVEIYYQRSEFPKGRGSLTGYKTHECTFAIDMQAAATAKADVAVINNPASTPGEIAAALAAMQDAKIQANESLDELWGKVWNILMAADNVDFDMDRKIGSRWLGDFEKNSPLSYGSYVVLTGSAQLTFDVEEEIEGKSVTALEEIYGELKATHDSEDEVEYMDPAPAAVQNDY